MVTSNDWIGDSKVNKQDSLASQLEALSRLQEIIFGSQHDVGKKSDYQNSAKLDKEASNAEQKSSIPSLSILDGGKKKDANSDLRGNESRGSLLDGHLKVHLSQSEKEAIGARIRKNESSTTMDDGGRGLTVWNRGENFPSMGIVHAIWQASGSNSQFGDSFKSMIKYMEDHKVPGIPKWLNSETPSPWKSKEQFDSQYNSEKMTELREFLAKTVPQQTDYAINRLEISFSRILASTDENKRPKVQENFNRMLKSGASGVFALVDYRNFKGEGLVKDPGDNSVSWGLRQVLENMKDTGDALADFSNSARQVLSNRTENAGKLQDKKFLPGWINRVNDYTRPLDGSEP